MKLVAIFLILIAVAIRIPMDYWPSVYSAGVFWVCIIFGQVIFGNYLLVPGMTCNAAAMLANDGFMPVYGSDVPNPGIHIVGTSDAALQFLCDRFAGFSVGDFLLTVAFLWMATNTFRRPKTQPATAR